MRPAALMLATHHRPAGVYGSVSVVETWPEEALTLLPPPGDRAGAVTVRVTCGTVCLGGLQLARGLVSFVKQAFGPVTWLPREGHVPYAVALRDGEPVALVAALERNPAMLQRAS